MAKTDAVIVPVTPFPQNCTLLWCEVTKRAVVIDPGGRKTIFERFPAASSVQDFLQRTFILKPISLAANP